MKRQLFAPFLLAVPFLLPGSLLGCTGPAPTVEILTASPETLSASNDAGDDLTITVRYTDADGDLGLGTARVIDCRAEGLVMILPIPRIAADEAALTGVFIEGEMSLVVSDIDAAPPGGDVPPACAELGVTAPPGGARVFCVVLTDAAGHESEGACTGPIAVEP